MRRPRERERERERESNLSLRKKFNLNLYISHSDTCTNNLTLRKPFAYRAFYASTVLMSAFLITFLSVSFFAPVEPTDAAEVLSALNSSNDAVSITTSTNTIDLSLTAGSAGAVRTALDTVRVTAGESGYQLYISTNGNNNSLVRDGATATGADATTGAPTYAVDDIVAASSVTDITAPAELSNNTWGFAVPSKNTTLESGSEDVIVNGFGDNTSYPVGDNSIATSKFVAVPTRENALLIAKRSAAASNVATNVYYGVRATSAKPSGMYKNTVTYTAIGDANTNGLASISPSRTNQLAGGETFVIATPSTLSLTSITSAEVTVDGQTCSNAVAKKNGALVNIYCTSPSLATGWHEVIATITTTSGSTETYTVNPGIEYYSDAETIVAMQDFSVANCASMLTGETTILKDARDGKTYSITRQADGLCWMTQNLRLGDPNQDITLTSADSDLPSGSSPFVLPASAVQTSGNTDWSTDVDTKHIYSLQGTENEYTYGAYYNWYTATAGTRTSSMASGDASGSICPKGWKLPSNTGVGSYTNLIQAQIPDIPISSQGDAAGQAYTSQFIQAPLLFVLSGLYGTSGLAFQGNHGHYWSRTAYASDYANHFYFSANSGNFYLQDGGRKYDGLSVRCVQLAPTMQQFASSQAQSLLGYSCSTMSTGATKELYDYRGNARSPAKYTIVKQADGNCWMQDNLQLMTTVNKDTDGTPTSATINQSVTLTPNDSDVSTNFTIPSSSVQSSGNQSWYDDTDDTSITSSLQTVHAYSLPVANLSYASAGVGGKSYGDLYNWYTATAGTGLRSTAGDAVGSICPKGWHLPSSTGNGSYISLLQAQFPGIPLGSDGGDAGKVYTSQFIQAPLKFVYSGYYENGFVNAARVNYLTRTAASVNNIWNFYFADYGYFRLQTSGAPKYYGVSVRCVLTP